MKSARKPRRRQEETEERKQEVPTTHKLLDDRAEMLSGAFRTAIQAQREDMLSLLNPLKANVE